MDGHAARVGVLRGALGHGPRDQDAVDLEADIVVEARGPVPLDDEPATGCRGSARPARRFRPERPPAWLARCDPARGGLRGLRKVALAAVLVQRHGAQYAAPREAPRGPAVSRLPVEPRSPGRTPARSRSDWDATGPARGPCPGPDTCAAPRRSPAANPGAVRPMTRGHQVVVGAGRRPDLGHRLGGAPDRRWLAVNILAGSLERGQHRLQPRRRTHAGVPLVGKLGGQVEHPGCRSAHHHGQPVRARTPRPDKGPTGRVNPSIVVRTTRPEHRRDDPQPVLEPVEAPLPGEATR